MEDQIDQVENRKKIKLYREKIFTRTMYCEKCAQNKMPRVGNIVLVYGSTNNKYYSFTIKKDAPVREYGFTPHIIWSPRVDWIDNTEIVAFNKCCAMHGCGIEIILHKEYSQADYRFIENDEVWLPVNDFLGLINAKDLNYYVYAK